MLKQARDSTRMQDLTSINKAIQTIQALDPDISLGIAKTVYVSIPDASSTCGTLGLPALPTGYTYHCVTTTNLHNVDGTGWIPVNFNDPLATGVGQISSLPIDPTNSTTTGLYYTYTPGGSFELTTLFESDKYAKYETKDGGVDPAMYERGTDLSLSPFIHGLVGYWPMDKGSGSIAYDKSGFGNDGSLDDASSTDNPYGPQWVSVKNGGHALSFNGTSDYVNAGNGASLNPTKAITIGAWVKLISIGINQRIVDKETGGSPSTTSSYGIIVRNTNQVQLQIWDSSGKYQSGITSQTLAVDKWYYIVAVYDGTNILLFINGDINSSTAIGSYFIQITNTNLNIGSSSSLIQYFNGKIDDVRIYNRALSPAEIEATYNASK